MANGGRKEGDARDSDAENRMLVTSTLLLIVTATVRSRRFREFLCWQMTSAVKSPKPDEHLSLLYSRKAEMTSAVKFGLQKQNMNAITVHSKGENSMC